MNITIPTEVENVLQTLTKHNFQAFLVGGCVRDLLLEKDPKDWDITTDANPEQIQDIFEDSFYENNFGTVGVKTNSEDPKLKVIEVTPFRIEGTYSDNRHPDSVSFGTNIEDDLKRRDFTINALAHNGTDLTDLHNGCIDLDKKVIRTVGDPEERFAEDALRIMRAIRFAAELNFSIDSETLVAIQKFGYTLEKISKERIRDEFEKLIMSDNPMTGLGMMQRLGLISFISPVFEEGVGCEQGKQAHKYDVWEHLLRSLQHAADKKYPLEIRLAALFHDISKPATKRVTKGKSTYFGHEVVGARVTKQTLEELHFSKEVIERVTKLVRWHMFFSDPDEITLTAVRRMLARVGEEDIWNLMNLRICDRIGSGRPKEEPYRFRKYQAMIEEVLHDPVSVSTLGIDGNVLMKELDIPAGPSIGYILHALLEEVLDDPKKNTKEMLSKRAEKLSILPLNELSKLGKKGKERQQEEERAELKDIRKKFHV